MKVGIVTFDYDILRCHQTAGWKIPAAQPNRGLVREFVIEPATGDSPKSHGSDFQVYPIISHHIASQQKNYLHGQKKIDPRSESRKSMGILSIGWNDIFHHSKPVDVRNGNGISHGISPENEHKFKKMLGNSISLIACSLSQFRHNSPCFP